MFAKNLKEIMTAKKISGARLARETGYSKAAISQYMNGINVPSPERIEAIAGALGGICRRINRCTCSEAYSAAV